jgi:hypothetical protein
LSDNSRLVISAMALRGSAPHEWESFVTALREYAAQQIAEMLRAPPDMLLKAQGMALGMQEISQMMNEAPALYDKLGQRSGHARRTDPRTGAAAAFTG